MRGDPLRTGRLLLLPWSDADVDILLALLNTASIRVLERIGKRSVPDCPTGGPPARFFEWRDETGG